MNKNYKRIKFSLHPSFLYHVWFWDTREYSNNLARMKSHPASSTYWRFSNLLWTSKGLRKSHLSSPNISRPLCESFGNISEKRSKNSVQLDVRKRISFTTNNYDRVQTKKLILPFYDFNTFLFPLLIADRLFRFFDNPFRNIQY